MDNVKMESIMKMLEGAMNEYDLRACSLDIEEDIKIFMVGRSRDVFKAIDELNLRQDGSKVFQVMKEQRLLALGISMIQTALIDKLTQLLNERIAVNTKLLDEEFITILYIMQHPDEFFEGDDDSEADELTDDALRLIAKISFDLSELELADKN